MIGLHFGGAGAGTVAITAVTIFFLVFAMSFAVGPVPEGRRRFSGGWFRAWFRASLPRIVIAGVFAALLFTASALSSPGQSDADIAAACESPLATNTGRAVTDDRLIVAVQGMRDIAAAARGGDMQQVRALFVTNDSHNAAHDIDAPLRPLDNSLARDLCESVLKLEREIAPEDEKIDGPTLAEHAEDIAAYLQTARERYQFVPPLAISDGAYCERPIGAVTSQPLTARRITEGVAALRQVADLAVSDEMEAAAQAFAGDAHNLAHDIDGPLRVAHEGLAIDLCEAVVDLEVEFAGGQDPGIISESARSAADHREQAGQEIGIL